MENSPFKPETIGIKSKDIISERFSLKSYAEFFSEKFIDYIPSDEIKNMPKTYKIILGSLLYSCLMIVFVYFLTTQYTSTITSYFLASTLDTLPFCSAIPFANSGQYYADNMGNWQGSNSFLFSSALYIFNFFNFIVDEAGFASAMNNLYSNLQAYGEISKTFNLGNNLLLLMAYKIGSVPTIFTTTASAAAVFNRPVNIPLISSINGLCNATATTSYGTTTGIIQITYNEAAFLSSPHCNELFPVDQFVSPLTTRSSGEFTVTIDTRSLILAAGLNAQIVRIENMLSVPASTNYVLVEGVNYTESLFYDSRHPGMSLVRCLYKLSPVYEIACGLLIGQQYGVPIFNHFGKNFTYPEDCICGSLSASELGANSLCNAFNFFYGFIYWPKSFDGPPLAIRNFVQPYLQKNTPGDAISASAFNASFLGSAFGEASRRLFPQLLNDSFQFCYSPIFGYCNMFIVTSADLTYGIKSISNYYYQLPQGACIDVISIPYSNFVKLINTPFSSLTESYQRCGNNPATSFIAALGVATANVGTFLPAVLVIVFILFYGASWMFGYTIPHAYSKKERDDALDAFAFNLLLSRDQALRGKTQKENETLTALVIELQANAVINPFVVDDVSSDVNWKNVAKRIPNIFSQSMYSVNSLYRGSSKNPIIVELGQLPLKADRQAPLGRSHLIPLNSKPSFTLRPTSAIPALSYLPQLRVMLAEMKLSLMSDPPTDAQFRSFWEIAASTNEFCRVYMPAVGSDAAALAVEDPSYCEFLSLLKELMLLHCSVLVGVDADVLKSNYRDRLMYRMHGQAVTLEDLDKQLTMV